MNAPEKNAPEKNAPEENAPETAPETAPKTAPEAPHPQKDGNATNRDVEHYQKHNQVIRLKAPIQSTMTEPQKIAALVQNLQDLHFEIADLKVQFAAQKGEMAQHSENLEHKTKRFLKTQDPTEALEEIGKLQKTVKDLGNEQGNIRNEHQKVVQERKGFEKLQKEQDKLKSTVEVLQNSHKQLQQAHGELQTAHDELLTTHEHLMARHEALLHKHELFARYHGQRYGFLPHLPR